MCKDIWVLSGENKNLEINTEDTTQTELATTLNSPQTSPSEYFKDLETTWKYPKAIQEVLEAWRICDILKTLREQWVNIIPSRENLLWFLPNDKLKEIWDLSRKHFWTRDFLTNYSWEWRQECSDGSDLYVPVKLNWKICLAKLACWEFNRQTFTEWVKRRPDLSLHKSEVPLFVVNQYDSYFADKGTFQADIRNIDVRLYLDLYTTIASLKAWEAVKRWIYDEGLEFFDWSQIRIPEYEELKSILSK